MEPQADEFRNYSKDPSSGPAEAQLVDKAQRLTLSALEMNVLIDGPRLLEANFGKSGHSVLAVRPKGLSTDFLVNLVVDRRTVWVPPGTRKIATTIEIGRPARDTGRLPVPIMFGPSPVACVGRRLRPSGQQRAIRERFPAA